MNRDQVLDLCYSADTLADVSRARRARADWLANHPDDYTVLDAGSTLFLLEEAIKMACAEDEFSSLPVPAYASGKSPEH